MAFTSYMNYGEYIELGGTVSEDKFRILLRKAQRYLDYFTFNRIHHLVVIPEVVKEVLTEYVNRLYLFDNQRQDGDVITKYSNGVETIEYELKTEDQIKREFYNIAQVWLPTSLLCRSLTFNAEQYLQPNCHHS